MLQAIGEKRDYEPKCWFSECRNADCQFDGLWIWLDFMLALKQSQVVVASGCGALMLEQAEAKDAETLSILIDLERQHERLLAEKREADRKMA